MVGDGGGGGTRVRQGVSSGGRLWYGVDGMMWVEVVSVVRGGCVDGEGGCDWARAGGACVDAADEHVRAGRNGMHM